MATADFNLLSTVITVKSFPLHEGLPLELNYPPGRYFVHGLMVASYGKVELGLCDEPLTGEVVDSHYVDEHHVAYFDFEELDIER
jgi:hypothetical protein